MQQSQLEQKEQLEKQREQLKKQPARPPLIHQRPVSGSSRRSSAASHRSMTATNTPHSPNVVTPQQGDRPDVTLAPKQEPLQPM